MMYQSFTIPNTSLAFRMIHVPGGHFIMGSPAGEPGRFESEKQHPVQLSDFWIAEFAVTQDEWTAVMGKNPSHFQGERHPVDTVSWFDAAVYCNALSVLSGKQAVYKTREGAIFGQHQNKQGWDLPNEGDVRMDKSADGFRLPSEAQWEYAAKGGPFALSLQKPPEKDFFYAGSDLLEQVGWYDKNSNGRTHPVGQLLPNALGLYDMSGNVWEWCFDWRADYQKELEVDPVGVDKGVGRVLRGGGWNFAPRYCRTAFRDYDDPRGRSHRYGFRLALQLVG